MADYREDLKEKDIDENELEESLEIDDIEMVEEDDEVEEYDKSEDKDDLDIEFVKHVQYKDDLSKLKKAYKTNPEAKRNRKNRFVKSFFIYSAVIAIVVFAIFWGYSTFFEKETPEKYVGGIDGIINQYLEKEFEGLYEDKVLTNEFEEKWMLSDYIKEIITVYEVKTKQVAGKDEYNIVYELSANDNKFARVYLTCLDNEGNVTDNWKVTGFDASEYLPVTNSYTITAPYGSEVYVNNKKLDSTYIQTEKQPVKILENVESDLKEMVYNTIYEVKGFFEVPKIEIIDADDNNLEVVEGSREFVAKYAESKETKKEFEQYSIDIMKAYAKYYVKLSDNINNYIRSQTNAYEMIKNGARYEYPEGMLASAKFIESGVSEFIRYTDDCFTCRITYKYAVSVVGKEEKEVFEKDMIWTFVKFKGLWYLTDINEYH